VLGLLYRRLQHILAETYVSCFDSKAFEGLKYAESFLPALISEGITIVA
jgi:hypothetical protein